MDSVVFDLTNRQLSNNAAFFAEITPETLIWTLPSDQPIQPGDTIGYWYWDDGTPATPIVAPADCSGYVLDVNSSIDFEQLGARPSQVLLELH